MKSTRLLPTIPWIIFGYIEPLLILNVAVTILLSPAGYASSQVDPALILNYPLLSPGAYSTVLQLANTCVIAAGVSILLFHVVQSRQAIVGYLVLTSVADIGHIMATASGMGREYFLDISRWNGMTWINMCGSQVILVLRLATLMGAFGEIRWEENRGVEAYHGKVM